MAEAKCASIGMFSLILPAMRAHLKDHLRDLSGVNQLESRLLIGAEKTKYPGQIKHDPGKLSSYFDDFPLKSPTSRPLGSRLVNFKLLLIQFESLNLSMCHVASYV